MSAPRAARRYGDEQPAAQPRLDGERGNIVQKTNVIVEESTERLSSTV